MISRFLQLPARQSYFLFGARGVGKSTLLQKKYNNPNSHYINLLDLKTESKYLRKPDTLLEELRVLPDEVDTVVIDEIQKIPQLLNTVHLLIEETSLRFILTGSSARKLRRGHANMLAGRAVIKNLYPFSFIELAADFDINKTFNLGMLPKLFELEDMEEKYDFLRAYCHTYLKEEVWAEHLIRKLEPFQYFLEIAAQNNGKVINASNIAKDVSVDHKSIEQYYTILEDTLLGFNLPSYNKSFRKRLIQKPKFYFIDLGIVRALSGLLEVPILPGTYDYGDVFEHFIITECYKLAKYFYPDYRLSYLRTTDGWEVDLVIERPGKKLLLIEIKSATELDDSKLNKFTKVLNEFGDVAEGACFANVPQAMKINDVLVYPWREGVLQYLAPLRKAAS